MSPSVALVATCGALACATPALAQIDGPPEMRGSVIGQPRGDSDWRGVDFDRVTIHGMVAEGLFRARGGSAVAVGKR